MNQEAEPSPTPESAPKREALGRRRPILITLLCMMGFIGFPFWAMHLSQPDIQAEIIARDGEQFYKIQVLSVCLFLFCYVGYWMMKRWGVWLCLILTLAMVAYFIANDMHRAIISCGHNLVIFLVGLAYLKEMD